MIVVLLVFWYILTQNVIQELVPSSIMYLRSLPNLNLSLIKTRFDAKLPKYYQYDRVEERTMNVGTYTKS